MYYEPEDDEEELYALRGALAGTRTPTGCLGTLGLLGSVLMLVGGVSFMLSPVSLAGTGIGVGAVYIVLALLYGIAPGILAAAAMQRPKDLDDNSAAVRQARLLMVFWWLAAVMVMATFALYFVGFIMFAGMGMML